MPCATIASISATVHRRRGSPSAACVVLGKRLGRRCSFMAANLARIERPPKMRRRQLSAPADCGARPSFPLDRLHRFVERLQETRAVVAGELGIVARAFPGLAQMLREVAHGQRHADAVVGKTLAGRADHPRAGPVPAGGERDVGGNDDIGLGCPLYDPVVGCVGTLGHDHPVDEMALGKPHPAVGDEIHRKAMPLPHPHRLLLHRAGVGIDEEGDGQSVLRSVQDRAGGGKRISD